MDALPLRHPPIVASSHVETPMPTLYHRTTAQAAQAILDGGFRDKRDHFGFKNEAGAWVWVEGLWLSDVPLDGSDFGHADRDTLLAVTLTMVTLGMFAVAAWSAAVGDVPLARKDQDRKRRS